MKNISIITSVLISKLDETDLPLPDENNEIDYATIPGADFSNLYITSLSGTYSEEEQETENGMLFNKSIQAKHPGIDADYQKALQLLAPFPLMAIVSDANGNHELVYPLLLSYNKRNPGTGSEYRGYSINMTGKYHIPSIFVTNMPQPSTIASVQNPPTGVLPD